MNYPKISIITPSFNQASYLNGTIMSVLNQNYPNLEYIIIDGASSDNSVNIIKNYEDRLSYWESEKDKGQSHAINKGLKRTTGEIVAWINSDDLYMPNTLGFIAQTFEENPDVDILYGDVINFYPNGLKEYYEVKKFKPIDFLSRVSIHQPAVFWRRKIHDQIGYLDESLHYTMDYDLWMRIFFNFKTLKVNKPLAKFLIHKNAKTANNPKELYLEYRKVLSSFFYSLNDHDLIKRLIEKRIYDNPENKKYNISFNNKLIKKVLQNYIYNCAIQEFTFGDKLLSKALFREVLFTQKFFKTLYFIARAII